jgi:hypothetical protein
VKPEAAAAHLSNTLAELDGLTAWALTNLGPAMEHHLAAEDAPKDAAGVVAAIQDLIRRLRDIESLAARAIGQKAGRVEGELPDGRAFTVRRTADRKAWHHDAWQHDARAKVADQLLADVPEELVDPSTGEAVPVGGLMLGAMAAIEAVHGAGAPKVTMLKALGLEPGDYCETVRGNWTVDAIALDRTPATPTATTTDSGEQNHG